jgi:hypothetical protein
MRVPRILDRWDRFPCEQFWGSQTFIWRNTSNCQRLADKFASLTCGRRTIRRARLPSVALLVLLICMLKATRFII